MTAEEFIEKNCINGCGDWMLDTVLKEFATLKCQELLEIVAEKANAKISYVPGSVNRAIVNKDSILNAVNLDEFIK